MGRNGTFSTRISLLLFEMGLSPRLFYAAVMWSPKAQREGYAEVAPRKFSKSGEYNTNQWTEGRIKHGLRSIRSLMYKAGTTAYNLLCQGRWNQARVMSSFQTRTSTVLSKSSYISKRMYNNSNKFYFFRKIQN